VSYMQGLKPWAARRRAANVHESSLCRGGPESAMMGVAGRAGSLVGLSMRRARGSATGSTSATQCSSGTGHRHRRLLYASPRDANGDTMVGIGALRSNAKSANTASRDDALQRNTSGNWNTASGSGALVCRSFLRFLRLTPTARWEANLKACGRARRPVRQGPLPRGCGRLLPGNGPRPAPAMGG